MNINSVTVVGRVGQDPEVRYTSNGTAVANFSLATSERWKDSNGERQEKTTWHRISFFGKPAEIAGEYVRKGGVVGVIGKLDVRKWQDKDGNNRETTEIVGRELILGPKPQSDDDRDEPRRSGQGRSSKPAAREEPQYDDDIPF